MGWITAVYQVISGVLRFDPDVYEAVFAHPNADSLALAVLLVVGLSISIGHSAVLFVNRVERKRFLLSFVLTAFTFVLGVLLLTFSIWLTIVILFNPATLFSQVLIVISLSFAPLYFWLIHHHTLPRSYFRICPTRLGIYGSSHWCVHHF